MHKPADKMNIFSGCSWHFLCICNKYVYLFCIVLDYYSIITSLLDFVLYCFIFLFYNYIIYLFSKREGGWGTLDWVPLYRKHDVTLPFIFSYFPWYCIITTFALQKLSFIWVIYLNCKYFFGNYSCKGKVQSSHIL